MAAAVSIGEFSRLTHISVKALRHYHDVGVLIPARVDGQSKYRSYELTQLGDAHLVRRLRELDMPLDAVRIVLAATSKRERDDAIALHLEHMERQLTRTREMVASLRILLAGPLDDQEISLRTVAAMTALSISAIVSPVDIEVWSQRTFGQLAGLAASYDLAMNGESGSLFGTSFFEEEQGPVTAFVGLESMTIDLSKALPSGCAIEAIAGGQYAVAVHRGPYRDLDCTYGTVGSYVNTHYVTAFAPIRERYLVGSDVASDPADFRTEVMWPVSC
jgi:DNA-binding transcriptional MerR regulator/predicted transcriptional regulator YdeE